MASEGAARVDDAVVPPRPDRWDALAAGLAHEIKNPLSTMRLTLQLLREDLQGRENPSPAKILPRVDLLITEVDRLQQILNDFQRLARKPDLELRRTDVNAMISDLQAFLGPEFAANDISLVIQLDHGTGEICADELLLRQALHNLLRNSVQAMPDGGTLTVTTRGQDDRLVVTIIDTGKGIPENVRSRIFDGFFSTKAGGTGIGLALTRLIVEQHGGTISCMSEPGQGTMFTLELPLDGPPGPGEAEGRGCEG